jgi:hypothetical protein
LQKTQEGIKEVGQIMDEQKTQLQKREEEDERLKDEVVGLKENMKRLKTQQRTYDKFRKSTEVLEDILNCQRSPYDKTGIGYGTKQEPTVEKEKFRSSIKENDGKLQNVANNLRNFNEENCKEKDCDRLRGAKKRPRRTAPLRRQTVPRDQSIFHGYFYTCNNYGHKAIHCRAHDRNTQVKNRGMVSFKIQCYNYHKYGHIARDCRQVWRRKE